jgi:hypothetical protein
MDCFADRLTRVRLLVSAGRDEEAAVILDLPADAWSGPHEVLWAIERGRVNERLGNDDKALEAFTFVANTWRNADPMLQPLVEEARSAVARLVAEPRR